MAVNAEEMVGSDQSRDINMIHLLGVLLIHETCIVFLTRVTAVAGDRVYGCFSSVAGSTIWTGRKTTGSVVMTLTTGCIIYMQLVVECNRLVEAGNNADSYVLSWSLEFWFFIAK
jgi:hypothetical protein